MKSFLLFILGIGLIANVAFGDEANRVDDQSGTRFFRQRIEPVLKKRCYSCHSADSDSVEGNLRLDLRAGIQAGGDSGPVINLRNIDQSLLLRAIRHQDGVEMPPGKPKLAAETIADFRKWIQLGAPDPRDGELTDFRIRNAANRHWAFQPVQERQPPAVARSAWVRNSIDAFILSALEQRKWHPSSPASRAEWLRRVYFDLTGLPPTPGDIDRFLADKSPHAFEQVVDSLLSSPRYGERWAQHWLDVLRYAETEGFEYDRHIPDAWRFRDYVISSLNADKPFDQFVIEQIAGDELSDDSGTYSLDDKSVEYKSAAIFHRLGAVRRNAGNPDIALSRNEVLTERTNIVGVAFLGLTVGCARCHNHKLEPITQRDYYRLQAYFAATQEHNVPLVSDNIQQAWEKQSQEVAAKIKDLKKKLINLSGEEKQRLERRIADLEYSIPPAPPTIPSIRNDLQKRTQVHVLRRGVWENKGVAVGPRPLSVLVDQKMPELDADLAKPRTKLAEWLVDPQHPLTARVIVNRIWQHHFGTGLVKTANDFGTHGSPPSHPELLDWLAAKLVENGWHLKPIHRLVVLSSVYRQSSRSMHDPEYAKRDPENRLLWKFNRRRLSAEEIRDAMLSVAGRLNLKPHGKSVMVPVDEELVGLLYKPAQWRVTPDQSEHDRRTIYLIAKRNLRLPFMEAFDAPALQTSCPKRDASTHAPQTLELLNGDFSNSMADSLANRLRTECGDNVDRIISRAFWLALGRKPSRTEHRLSSEFLRSQSLREFALAVLNLNGFLYVR